MQVEYSIEATGSGGSHLKLTANGEVQGYWSKSAFNVIRHAKAIQLIAPGYKAMVDLVGDDSMDTFNGETDPTAALAAYQTVIS